MTSLYRDVFRPLVFRADAERIHEFGLKSLRAGLSSGFAQRLASKRFAAPDGLETRVFGLKFKNPVGLAAGFDKNAEAVDQLASLGFGFIEVGTVTRLPQQGNPKPRMFRLIADNALINRLGFNNGGADAAVQNIRRSARRCVVGINIGKNKDVPNEEAVTDYVECLKVVYRAADYITVNVSSPNTPNLRALQHSSQLDQLLEALTAAARELNEDESSGKPLLLKIAPDLSYDAIDELIGICAKHRIDGIVATNTTIRRDDLQTPQEVIERIGDGGLSGEPLRQRSTDVIRHIYRQTKGKLPVIGVGGIFSAAEAFEKITAGASLVQGYTGFVYVGPSYAREINRGLKTLLESEGFSSLEAAVGSKS